MQTAAGLQETNYVLWFKMAQECQDQKTQLKCAWERMLPKEIQSEVPSEDNEEGGKCPQSCSPHAKQFFL